MATNESKSNKPSRTLRAEVVALQNASLFKLIRTISEVEKSGQAFKVIGQPQTLKPHR
ncbi:hypothetical protein [Stenotrophomonas sp.]|uniref:hypothetical protein n=1 Tax=Stenotrophomonas sp. TaxID=69392 RepID=UPI002899BCAE|nr:hypothetical protein [Stenotrophomonas sp.]